MQGFRYTSPPSGPSHSVTHPNLPETPLVPKLSDNSALPCTSSAFFRYILCFSKDADVLTAAFQEFSAKKLTQDKKPSIRKLLSDFRQKAAALNAQREQVKNKDRGRER